MEEDAAQHTCTLFIRNGSDYALRYLKIAVKLVQNIYFTLWVTAKLKRPFIPFREETCLERKAWHAFLNQPTHTLTHSVTSSQTAR